MSHPDEGAWAEHAADIANLESGDRIRVTTTTGRTFIATFSRWKKSEGAGPYALLYVRGEPFKMTMEALERCEIEWL